MIHNFVISRLYRGLLLWGEMFETLKAFPRPVWILFVGTFLNKFGSFVMPFLALYMTRRGYTTKEAGIALGAYGIGHFIACGLGGHMADTIGRKKTIVISMISAAVVMVLLSQVDSLPWILFLTGLAGLTAELYRPASSALLADLVPANQRVTAYAAYRLAFNAGFAFGPATAGLLAEHSMTILFIGDALTSLLFGIVAWQALPDGATFEKSVSWRAASKEIARDHRLQQFLIAIFLVALIFYQMGSTYGLHITGLGFSASVYGILLSMNGILVAVFELPLTALTQTFPAKRTMAIGFALVGLGFSINAVASSIPILACAMIIFTIGEMISMPLTSAYVASLAPSHLRGRYMGTSGLTWAIGLIIGPGFGMMLFDSNPGSLWAACGVLGLLGAAVISFPNRELRK